MGKSKIRFAGNKELNELAEASTHRRGSRGTRLFSGSPLYGDGYEEDDFFSKYKRSKGREWVTRTSKRSW